MADVESYCAAACSRFVFQPRFTGGAGNQREGVITGVLIALALQFRCLVVPRVELIPVASQEQGTPLRTDYKAPFDRRDGWSRFDNLFDRQFFTERLQQVGLCTVDSLPQDTLVVNVSHWWHRLYAGVTRQPAKVAVNMSLQAQLEHLALTRLRNLSSNSSSLAWVCPGVGSDPKGLYPLRYSKTPKPCLANGYHSDEPHRTTSYQMNTGFAFRKTRGESEWCWWLHALCSFVSRSVSDCCLCLTRAQIVCSADTAPRCTRYVRARSSPAWPRS